MLEDIQAAAASTGRTPCCKQCDLHIVVTTCGATFTHDIHKNTTNGCCIVGINMVDLHNGKCRFGCDRRDENLKGLTCLLNTLIHEVAHCFSGDADHTVDFYKAMEDIRDKISSSGLSPRKFNQYAYIERVASTARKIKLPRPQRCRSLVPPVPATNVRRRTRSFASIHLTCWTISKRSIHHTMKF